MEPDSIKSIFQLLRENRKKFIETYTKKGWFYVEVREEHALTEVWLASNITGDYNARYPSFFFEKESDAVLFALVFA